MEYVGYDDKSEIEYFSTETEAIAFVKLLVKTERRKYTICTPYKNDRGLVVATYARNHEHTWEIVIQEIKVCKLIEESNWNLINAWNL